jgi:DNA-binding NtrC family response regulator
VTHSGRKTLLIIDDERPFCAAVRDYVENERLEVLSAHTSRDGLQICSSRKIDVVLLDQKLPDGEGHALAPAILATNAQAKIIFITAFPSFENAVTAVRMGAHDYLSKPVDPEELRLMIENAVRTLELEHVEEVQNYTREKERSAAVLVGAAGGLAEVEALVERAAAVQAPVLITGETGTGKNLVAKNIHFKSSSAPAAFISINCAALPDTMIESELFGHEKGSFTGAGVAKKGLFEMADGGTLFLDEIGEMPLHLQTKLLSVIEDKTVRRIGGTAVQPANARIIAATNSDLETCLGKTFRKDLYYRLSVLRIHIPPLRDHREDIPPLCSHLLAEIARGRELELPDSEKEKLIAYDWPGNVRELKNILERSVILQKGPVLRPSLLLGTVRGAAEAETRERPDTGGIKTLEQSERENIRIALSKTSGNVTQAAKALGISLSTLKRKIKEYQLTAKPQ